MKKMKNKTIKLSIFAISIGVLLNACKPNNASQATQGDASKAYVAPGKYDEFYNFVSGDLADK